jgi:2-iminoacetate synthase
MSTDAAVRRALAAELPGAAEFEALIGPAGAPYLERMAQRAQALTRRHFGRTMSLYAPLYLANFCPGGCAYCGFASDRHQSRRALEPAAIGAELEAIHALGFEEVLLLTGDRTPRADYDYLRAAVALAAKRFHLVTVESFSMTEAEYRGLVEAGCTGVTLYQETYDPVLYEKLHRWGPKRDYAFRLEAPARALAAGMRTVGLGVLLGLADPVRDVTALFRHLERLEKAYWRGGFSVSFPRIRPQQGGFTPAFDVDDALLARLVFAFRLCRPELPLVLSTRENAAFRDGMAGLGITKMSAGSRTTVGGYQAASETEGQFEVSDSRDAEAFRAMLRRKGLDPVSKNWDRAYSAG